MAQIREQASTHIKVEEAIWRKKANEEQKQGKYKDNQGDHQPRNIKTSSGRRPDQRYISYVVRRNNVNKSQSRHHSPNPKFNLSHKLLLVDDDVANKLEFSRKIDRTLGNYWEAWCEFHQTHGHNIERCLTLYH